MSANKKPLLGAHVSVAGGFVNGITNGERIGAQCIQIFGAAPQQWAAKLPTAEQVSDFKKALGKSSIKSVFLHGPYLINLAADTDVQLQKSINGLAMHLKIAEAIGAQGLIFHVGSGKDSMTKEQAIKQAAKAMKEVLKLAPGKAFLVMENSASNKKVGATPEELAEMLKIVGSPRVKVCIDTAHAFEAGLVSEYSKSEVKKFFDNLDRTIGLENIVAMHANDSKTASGSNHDRHENIGQGLIGKGGFKNLFADGRLNHASWFLEVPGYDGLGPDKKNLDILKGCI